MAAKKKFKISEDGALRDATDEETANLVRYQQAYLAASKVMQMAQKLFDSVLAIAG